MRTIKDRTQSYHFDSFGTDGLYGAAYDSGYWQEVIGGTGTVTIASGKMRCNVPVNADVAGLVSKRYTSLRNARITITNVDVATSPCGRAGIVLAKTKVTATNPALEANMLSIELDQVNDHLLITSNVAAAGVKTLYDAAWTDGDGKLIIDIESDGLFTVYEDAVERYVGSLPFLSTSTDDIFCFYVYVFGIATVGLTGYGGFDNVQLDLDERFQDEILGHGVVRNSSMPVVPVIGRFFSSAGAEVFFETDHAVTDTPTQRILLSRNVKMFRLEEIRFYMNPTNAETYQLYLFGKFSADDVESLQSAGFISPAAMADSSLYIGAKGMHLATGAAVATLDTPLPQTMILQRLGQIAFNMNWSGAPGVTPGLIEVVGYEVD